MSDRITFLEPRAARPAAIGFAVAQSKSAAFAKVKDSRGRQVEGLWQRNGRFYCQLSVPGKGCRRVPLLDESNQAVTTVTQATDAMHELRKKKRQGELPTSGRGPLFKEYVVHYLEFIETTAKKKRKTIGQEKGVLAGWVKHLGDIRLAQITKQRINEYVMERKSSGVGNRTANYDVLVLSNCLKFAKEEGCFHGKLPTEGYRRLKYIAPKRPLFTKDQLEHCCQVALQKNADGTPKYRNGELLADSIRFMRPTGARVTSALATRWSDVDWQQQQVHLRNTKYDKQNIVVDFNDELKAVLTDMYARRLPDSDFMFPATRGDADSVGSLRATFEVVRAEAGLPELHFHDCRHFFISECVMSGVDFMTIAKWVGHADGGLIAKVYSHLSNEHTQRAAKKVTFGNGGSTSKPELANAAPRPDYSVEQLLQMLKDKMAKA